MQIIRETPTSDAEGVWSYEKTDAKEILTYRRVGMPDAVIALARAASVGSASAPGVGGFENGNWVCVKATAEYRNSVEAQVTIVYETLVESSETGTELPATQETADVQPIERPVSSLDFWTEAFPEGGTTRVHAAKFVQEYVDAETVEAADAVLAKAAAAGLNSVAMNKMIGLKLDGIEAYLYPAPTLSTTTVSDVPPNDFGSDVGKIASPNMQHVPIPAEHEWLGNGDCVTWSNGVFTRTRKWLGAKTWDRRLYTSAEGN